MRVVGSLTTIPSRIAKLEPTLISIANQSYQLQELYLNIPADYPSVPLKYEKYCRVIRGKDYGPITKLIGPLLQEKDPDTIIITFDDDKVYPEGLVEKLITKHKSNPNCAIGSSGFKIGSFPFYISMVYNEYKWNTSWYTFPLDLKGDLVDVLVGAPGVLYMRKFFPKIDQLLDPGQQDPLLFKHDNIVISGVLSKLGIERKVFKMPEVTDAENIGPSSLFKSHSQYLYSLVQAIYQARKRKMFAKTTPFTRNKTLTYPAILIFVMLVICSILLTMRNSTNNS